MAANNIGNAFGSQEQSRKEKSIEVDEFTIKGHLLRWKDVAIQISNISLVTAVDVAPPEEAAAGAALRKLCGALLTLAGLLLLVVASFGRMSNNDAGTFFALGCGSLIAGIAILVYHGQEAKSSTKRYLDIYLASGNRYSILFEDDAFRQKVLDLFSVIFRDGANEITVPTNEINIQSGIQSSVIRGSTSETKVPQITISIKDSEFKGNASVIKELNSIIKELNMV